MRGGFIAPHRHHHGRARGRRPLSRCGAAPPMAHAASPPRSPRPDLPAQATDGLEGAVATADIVSCATLSTAPMNEGRWLRAGQRLDLVGAFSMSMREVDDETLRCARIFVDAEAACVEGDYVAIGLANGVITRAEIAADRGGRCAEARKDAGRPTRSPSSSRSGRRSKTSPRPSSSGASPAAPCPKQRLMQLAGEPCRRFGRPPLPLRRIPYCA